MMQSPKAPRSEDNAAFDSITGPGGGHASPASPSTPGFIAHLRDSVWAPIVLKAGGGMIALCALGLMGAASLHGRALGAPVAPVGSEWVAAGDAPAASSSPAASAEPASAASARPPAPCVPAGSAAPGSEGAPGAASASSGGVLPDGRVVLNLATVEDLQRLPGVGQRRAEAILELRARLKKFRRTTDLLRVRGIGAKSLKRLEPLLVVDPPEPPKTPTARP
jgi:competence protein ComEA